MGKATTGGVNQGFFSILNLDMCPDLGADVISDVDSRCKQGSLSVSVMGDVRNV